MINKRKIKKIKRKLYKLKSVDFKYKFIICFFAVFIILSFISRGIYVAMMPQVTAGTTTRATLVESINFNGNIKERNTYMPLLPPNLKIEKVNVLVGQNIAEGDVLAYINLDNIKINFELESIKLEKMLLEHEILCKSEVADSSLIDLAQINLSYAEKNIQLINENGVQSIAEASFALQTANTNLENARITLEKIQNDTESTQQQIEDAKKEFESLAQNVKQLESNLINATNIANSNNFNASKEYELAKNNLVTAQTTQNEEIAKIEEQRKLNILDADVLLIEIEEQKNILALYDNINEDGGVISTVSGTVAFLETSEMLFADNFIKIAQQGSEMLLHCNIPKEQAIDLQLGIKANIIGANLDEEATLLSIINLPQETYATLVFSLSESSLVWGQSVDVEIILNEKTYDYCVPIGAINENSNGYFIYTIEKSADIMGIQNTIKQTYIDVLATSEELVAIQMKIHTNNEIVFSSDKLLNVNDVVRIGVQ